MQDLVGIIRIESELLEAKEKLAELDERAAQVRRSRATVSSTRAGTSPSTWSRCSRSLTARRSSAIERQESRGGHTREDYPGFRPGVREGQHGHASHRRRVRRDARSRSRRCPTSWRSSSRRSALMAIDTGPTTSAPAAPAPDAPQPDLVMRLWRGDVERRQVRGLPPARPGGRGRARRRPPHPGRRRRPTSRCAGTARPASAARAAPRSTAGRASCA